MKYKLLTNHPIAVDSPDHIHPRCTRRDNTINPRFNEYLIDLFEGDKPSVLDFGCAGGGMVRSLIDDGCNAVGLEGSDYNKKHQRAEWGVIPDNLLTCDVGFPFSLSNGSGICQFDVITAWEHIEHLPEDRLSAMITNMRCHLKPGGWIIGSTSSLSSSYEGIEHHLTRRPIDWWNDLFRDRGFVVRTDIEQYFDENDAWLRVAEFGFVYRKRL
ncbi:MAG: class I SAM-dependent methyltransferase [Planctomycetota bacterium]|jgi:cyclopropane fatty-acyl-phospholipid synthase-like methyltransferase